mmetsp:Transcript_6819/g.9538  ORF Transcript_6819/g.9538 Transcript_6819/m.9538 type:complete len:228 (-) Transcript_6819:30-713(-)|eukprot:CAMPEP_0197354260 /NCGR_PEP_ID=MMETSP0893-20130614/42617_1 /TAXON_ID=44058 ORGANISM="Aureoumbra lagunensis, Strain CCMP1510" /NCGR_SAMPLE_ID=MMETSP0893 /ASSEMBLY_ACC=CAM_ASM_000539 /LENGTH=227 /DNA_ID=CAMNT_0042870275 /DNA_START=21 /DNA_END=704 /DNA_ORIENTATION=-
MVSGFVTVIAITVYPIFVLGQFAGGMGPGGMPMEAKPIYKSAKALECLVCKQATEELWQQVEDATGKLHEDDLQDMATALCDPDSDEGEWILFYDVTQAEPGAPLKLERQEYLGECRRECRTIAKACRTVYDEYREDVAEALYKRSVSSLDRLKSRVCNKWANVCPTKPVPNYEHPDEWWMPVDEEMYKMKKMQQMINKQAEKYGKQPVQFVDPMQSAMFMDEEDEL